LPSSTSLAQAAAEAGEDVDAALALVRELGHALPLPGDGRTQCRWDTLSTTGRASLTVARVLEAHADALAILAEAGQAAEVGATYGVFAAEAGDPLRAESDPSGVRLVGVKHWCSLGSRLDAALVTAQASGGRQLFHVDLRHPSVQPEPTAGWVARGLRSVTSTGLRFRDTPARPVGGIDWYLTRPGFSWGGIGVAACWHGGTLALRDQLLKRARPDQLGALQAGNVDVAVHGAEVALAHAATLIDSGRAHGAEGDILALRTRAMAAAAADTVLAVVTRALGPAPLAFDEEFARQVADLQLYVRQHHGERDLAALGAAAFGAER